jgi:DNA-binding transcriptional regulator YiaG
MPNIAAAFKAEMIRIARKEARVQTEPLRAANAALKREVSALRVQLKAVEKAATTLPRKPKAAPIVQSVKSIITDPVRPGRRARFSPNLVRTRRERLGLSAEAMASLLGVTGQSVRNWEAGSTEPRDAQRESLAALAALGKRKVKALLEAAKAAAAQ